MTAVEMEERVTPPPADMSRYVLLSVKVSNLFMDRRYQRGLVKTQVKKLVNGWDWEKYHPIIISHRADGRYAVIAGQQRTTAAIEIGIQELPAVLITKTNIEQEAKSYLGSGATANIQASDKFKARLVANEAKAMDIWNVVEKAGFSFACLRPDEGGRNDPYAIKAVAATESIYDVEPKFLTRVLTIIRGAWGDAAVPDMVTSPMLRGVYLAMRHLETFGVTDEEVVKNFNRLSVKETIDDGASRYRSMTQGRSMDAGVAAVLIDAYNYRKRAENQVPMFTKASSSAIRATGIGRKRWQDPADRERMLKNLRNVGSKTQFKKKE